METITGQVRSMRIVRDGWGLAEVAIHSDDRAATVTGTLLGFDVGDTIEAIGAWSMHPRFGRQFKAKTIIQRQPSSADGFIGWLARKLPNVGRKRATALVEHFGGADEAHAALLGDPGELEAVSGITAERAVELCEAYRQIQGERRKMEAFVAFGLTNAQIARVEEAWGESALDRMRADPYELAAVVSGFGFKRADAVALRMGMPRMHPSRVVAGLHYLLEQAEGAGHTWTPAGKLIGMAARLLEVADADVRPHFARAVDGRVAVDRSGWVFRTATDAAEQSVARSVVAMLGASSRRVAA